MATTSIFVGMRANCRPIRPWERVLTVWRPQAKPHSRFTDFAWNTARQRAFLETMIRRQMLHDGNEPWMVTDFLIKQINLRRSQLDHEIDHRKMLRSQCTITKTGRVFFRAIAAVGVGCVLPHLHQFDLVMWGGMIFWIGVLEAAGRMVPHWFRSKTCDSPKRLRILEHMDDPTGPRLNHLVEQMGILQSRMHRVDYDLTRDDDEDDPRPEFASLRFYSDRLHDAHDAALEILANVLALREIAEKRYDAAGRAMISRAIDHAVLGFSIRQMGIFLSKPIPGRDPAR